LVTFLQVLLDVQTVANMLNVAPRTINRMIERWELAAFKVAGMERMDTKDVQASFDAHRRQPKIVVKKNALMSLAVTHEASIVVNRDASNARQSAKQHISEIILISCRQQIRGALKSV